MLTQIYEPKGRAREYSPLAFNIYGRCAHECLYCYASRMTGQRSCAPRWGAIGKLTAEVSRAREGLFPFRIEKQCLLSFLCDPYPPEEMEHEATKTVLRLLAGIAPVAVLTKGGDRALRDLDLYAEFASPVKVGATLTFQDSDKSSKWEPKAGSPQSRVQMLAAFHDAGVKTFASFEPVIEPDESLAIMETALPYLDEIKIGKWNHDQRANATDWHSFLSRALALARPTGVAIYVKDDLRDATKNANISAEESDSELHHLRWAEG